MRTSLKSLAPLALLMVACQADISNVPPGALLECMTSADCPPTAQLCNASHLCVPADSSHATEPDVAAAPTITPPIGTRGTTFTVSLVTNKPLKTPPTMVLDITPAPVEAPACVAGSTTTQYTCTYTGEGTEFGGLGGTIWFDLTFSDFDQNTFTHPHAGSFILDFTPPVLESPGVSPKPMAGNRNTIYVSFVSNKALDPDFPVVVSSSVPLGGTTMFTPVNTPQTLLYNLEYTLQDSLDGGVVDPNGPVTFSVTLKDIAGNTNQMPLTIGTTTIDQTIPTITNPAIENTLVSNPNNPGTAVSQFSEIPGYNVVELQFDVAESVDPPLGTLTVTIGEASMACGTYSAAGKYNYTCTYNITGSETPGPQSILIEAKDAAGNMDAITASANFDFTPLDITAVPTPDPAKFGDTPVVAVVASKDLPAAPMVTSSAVGTSSGTLGSCVAAGAMTGWTCTYPTVAPPLAGTFSLHAAATDDVGHMATAMATLVVDANVPALSAVQTFEGTTTRAASRFSAQAGYDQMTLTFDSTKALTTVGVTFGLCKASGTSTAMQPCAMTCGAYQIAQPNYSCTYQVTGNELNTAGVAISTLANASLPVALSGADAAGNQATAGTTITLDFAAPTLLPTPTATPPVVGAGQQETIIMAVNEALIGAPALTPSPMNLTFTAALDTTYTFEATIPPTLTSGSYTTQIVMTDLVGNTATLAGPAFAVDSVIPVISDVSTNGPRFSAVTGYNQIQLTFDVTKSLDHGPASSPSVALGGLCPAAGSSVPVPSSLVCQPYQLNAPNYTCKYKVTGNELTAGGVAINTLPEAILPVSIQGTDEAANLATASTTVTLDFTPPSLLPTPTATPANVGAGQVETITLAASEGLQAAPTVTTSPSPIAFVAAAGTTYSFRGTVDGSVPSGAYTTQIAMVDLAGNSATVAGPDFNVDTNVPKISAVITLNAARFSAVPSYNEIQLTFGMSKSLDTAGSSLSVELNALCPMNSQQLCPFTCGAYQSATQSYTCSYAVTGLEATSSGTAISSLPSASVPVVIVGVDEAGNEGTATTTATLDFAPPLLLSSAALVSTVGVGQTESLQIAPSESLLAPPALVVSGPGITLPFALQPQTTYTFDNDIQAADPSGAYTSVVTMTDVVGNESAPLTGPSFTVDTLVPTISNVKTNASVYSEASGFNVVTLTFGVAKSVGAGLAVTLSGRPMTCLGNQALPPAYSCTYSINKTTDTAGPQTILIQAVDEAGNTTGADATVSFDFTPLVIAGTVAPNPARSGVTPVFAVSASKPLLVAPTPGVTSGGVASTLLGTPTTAGSGTSWTFTYATTAPPLAGSFSLSAQATDAVGHTASTAAVTFTVDANVPAISGVATNASTYSEVTGFNTVSLTFNTTKSVDPSTGGALTATIGTNAFACGTHQTTAPNYTCTYAVTLAKDTTGSKSITILATDEVGNTAVATTSVFFDLTPVTLTGLMAPNPAKAGVTPVFSVSASKPLSGAPTITVKSGTTVTTALGTPTVGGAGTSWTFSYPVTAPPLDGTFVLIAQGTDDVGHTGTTSPAVSFVVDAVIPTIANVATNASTYSEVAGFNTVSLTFNTPKTVDPSAGGMLVATIGGNALTCGSYQSTSPSYTCTYTVTLAKDTTGSKSIAITAIDDAGNTATATSSVFFDLTPVTLTSLIAPSPAKAGVTPVLSVSASKPLSAAPNVVVKSGTTVTTALGTPTVGGAGTSWTFSYPVTAPPLDGTFTLTAQGTDSVGHVGTSPATFVVDAVVPTISNVATGAATYSEVAGFNTVTLAFNTTKSVDGSAGGTLSATLAGASMTCGAFKASAPSYTCTYTVSPTADTTGAKAISITAVDEVGNSSSASTSVTFDLTPLVLSSQLAPSPAKLGSIPVMTVTASKSLPAAPMLTSVTTTGPATGSLGSPVSAGAGTAWSLTFPPAAAPLQGTFNVTVSAQDSVGHVQTTTASMAADAIAPVLSNLAANAQRYSAVTGFNQITVTMGVNKSLSTAGSSLVVALDAECPLASNEQCLFTCGAYQSATKSYTCTYQITGSELTIQGTAITQLPQANVPVLATATDEAGNIGAATTTVTLDFQAPSLASSSATVPVAGVGRQEQLLLTASEALETTPALVVMGAGNVPAFVFEASTAYAYSYTIQSTDPSGTYTSLVTMTDVVGNQSLALAGPGFTVDTVVPVISNVQTNAATYSQVSGFNLVTLTFNTAKVVSSGLTATLSGFAMACNTSLAPHYTCTYTATTAVNTSGPQTIAIQAVDEAGNTSSANITIDFDFTALTISGTMSPNPAKSGVVPVYSVSASKALSTAPAPVATLGGSASTLLGTPSTGGSGTSWTFSYPITASPLAGSFSVSAQATDVVGHTASALPTTFVVDALIPTITNVATSAQTYSEVSGFNTVKLTFNTPKSVDPATGSTLAVTLAGVAMTCGTYQATAPNYTCTYGVTLAKDTSGAKAINIAATDEVGNTSSATTSVTFDLTALTITGTVAPSPAKAGSIPVFSVSASKPLPAAPTLLVTLGGSASTALGAPVVSGSGTSWTFTFPAVTSPLTGTFGISAAATDAVGHTFSSAAVALTADGIVPAISGIVTSGGAANAGQVFSECGPVAPPAQCVQTGTTAYNVVTVAFNTPKAATVSAIVDGITMTCGSFQSGSPSYTCTSRALKTTDGSGTQIIALTATDEVGNASQGTASLVFDFTPLTLSASAAPNPANFSSVLPALSVSAGKPLPTAPTATVSPVGTVLGQLTTGAASGSGTAWSIPLQVAVSPVAGSFTLTATGVDNVGHAQSATASLKMNNAIPVISNIGLNASRFSAQAGFNTVTLSFNYKDDLDPAAASQLSAVIGGFLPSGAAMTMTCGSFQAAPLPSYTCTYTALGTEFNTNGTTLISSLPQAVLPISIAAIDSVGNEGFGSTSTTFDFMPPALASAPAIQYLPAPNAFTTGTPAACLNRKSVLTSATAATTCTDIRASFTMTEQLASNPTVTAASGVIAFGATTAVGLSYIYDGTTTTAGTPPDNAAYALNIVAKDLVGNPATLTSGSFALDTAPPATLNTSPSGPINYARAPYGSADAGTPSFTVTGGTGAADGGSYVIVYDSPNLANADQIGLASVSGTGSFSVPLSRDDRVQVYVASVDEAGNQSPVVATHNTTWTTTFDGKITGNTAVNPNVAVADPIDTLTANRIGPTRPGATLLGTVYPASTIAPEVGSYASLFPGSTTPLTTVAQGAWVEPPTTTPGVHYSNGMAYDSARGVTLVFDGSNTSGLVADMWEWNGSTWTELFPPVMPPPRAGPAMAYDSARGVTVLFGGYEGGALNDTWEWNGVTWTQRFPATSPPARESHSMAYDSSRGVTVLFGGSVSGSGTFGVNDTWEWNGINWTQRTLNGATSGPSQRQQQSLAYDSNRGVTVLFGGATTPETYLNDTWEWNGVTWTQRVANGATGAPSQRFGTAMSYDPARGLSIAFGGENNTVGLLADTWGWNGTTWAQLPATGPVARTTLMVYDSSRAVTVMFGGSASAGYQSDTWELNGAGWIPRVPATPPSGRIEAAMAYDSARGVSVLFAGDNNGQGYLNDTWEWNGTGWTNRTVQGASTSPPVRPYAVMDYDSARGVMVMFGGNSLNDTWEWNGTTWTERTVNGAATSPSQRTDHVMAYDSARGESVVFGGYISSGPVNDTWEWNGTTWTQRLPTASPSARTGHVMAYDSGRGVTVLFGGTVGNTPTNDTWEWNGTNWTQRTANGATGSPTARGAGTLVYDSATGTSILFGGVASGGVLLADTWAWNGTTWTQLQPAVVPPAHGLQAAAYDALHGNVVFFGGDGESGSVNDTWMLPDPILTRPTALLHFDFGATGDVFSTVSVQQFSLVASVGGIGYGSPSHSAVGLPVTGAAVAVWDDVAGGSWDVLTTNTATASSPAAVTYSSSSLWSINFSLSDETEDFAVFPIQPAGNGPSSGEVAVESPELTLQYQHTESVCTVTGTSSCICASDETACASGSAFVCSDVSVDPQNCGGCTVGGSGTICAGGTTCVGGACSCPGTETMCNSSCTDTTQDPNNCGGCGTVCGNFKACSASVCSKCQAGQAFVSNTCVNDIAVRYSVNLASTTGTDSIAIPAAVQAGDQMFVITSPQDDGLFTAAVSSASGVAWTLVGLGNDAGEYMAVYTKTAQTADISHNITVTMSAVATGTAERLNATFVDVYSQSGATLSVDASGLRGSLIATDATAAGITTGGTAPAITTTGPNEVVIIAAAQAGTTVPTLPAGTTLLTDNGGFITGYYTFPLTGSAPTLQFTGGTTTTPWEIMQLAVASTAH